MTSLLGVRLLSPARPYRPRRLMLIAALALLLLPLPPLGATAHGRVDRPTIVLVHGAWAGPSSWGRVVRDLHDDGYRTVTPTLGLQSLDADVATVRAALDSIEFPRASHIGGITVHAGRFTALIEQAVEATTTDKKSVVHSV